MSAPFASGGLASLAVVAALACAAPLTMRESPAPPGPPAPRGPRAPLEAHEPAPAPAPAPIAAQTPEQTPAQTPAKGETELSSAEHDELEQQVLGELRAYYRDFSARDWPAFRDHFWPGAIIASRAQPQGETRERVVATPVEEFIEKAPTGPRSREIFDVSMLGCEVQVSHDLAQGWAHFGARYGSPGEVMEWKGTDAFTLVRHEDRWRIAALAVSGAP